MPNNKSKVSIVILTWNGLKDTLEVLKNIEGLKTQNVKVETIVVDNGSADNTSEVLKNFKLKNSDFKLIRNKENLGFAGGNNIGIKSALKGRADYILLLNNDVILHPSLLTKLVGKAQSDSTIGLISPKMYFAPGYEFHKDRYKKEERGKVFWYAGGVLDWNNVYASHRGVDEVDHGQYEKQINTDFANGACVLIRSEVFKKVGLLNDGLFLYWEDVDFSQRAKSAGFKVVYIPQTHLWHKVSSATGGSGSASNDYFMIRNRLIFGMKYASVRTKFALFRDSIRTLFKGRPWQRRGVLDFYLGVRGKGSWGKKK